MQSKPDKQCLSCGKVRSSNQYDYYTIMDVFETYQVCDINTLCFDCNFELAKPVNYYGVKSDEEIELVKNNLRLGVLPQRQFQMQMNGGYFEQTVT